MMRFAAAAGLLCFCLALTAASAPPPELDYQGRVLVNDVPFTGTGYFKFAIANESGTTNFWSNDGTGSGQPAASNALSVFNGIFSTILGRSPMTAMNPDIFDDGTGLFLRVWFSDTGAGYSELLPAQRVAVGAFSVNADQLDGLHASEIIAAATGSVSVTLAGDVVGPAGANSLATGVIVNADISAAAAIAATKIANTALVQNTAHTGDVAGVFNNLQIQAGVIVDADVSASAGIEGSKVQAGTTTNAGVVQIAAGATGTAVIAEGDSRLNAFGAVNSIVAGAPNSGFGIVGSNNVIVSVSGTNVVINSPFVPGLDNVVWVATNGTPSGPGTIERPYDSPQAGHDAAAARYPTSVSVVVIASGDYAGGLAASNASVHVVGLYRPRIASLTVAGAVPSFVGGYRQIDGVVVRDVPAVVGITASGVRFRNCRFEFGASVNAANVAFQDCALRAPSGSGPALAVAAAPGVAASVIGVYQSTIENNDAIFGAIQISFPGIPSPNVQGLEVIGCEIVNREGTNGPAVQDWTPFHGPGFPVNLFTHNYIKGPPPGGGFPAIADPGATGAGPFLGVYNNTIYGDVGSVVLGVPHAQFFGLNMVYGLITYPGAGPVGWTQAGAGAGVDAHGNLQHQTTFPPMPDSWND